MIRTTEHNRDTYNMSNIHYTKLRNTTKGKALFLCSLTPKQAEQLGAQTATDQESLSIESMDGVYAQLRYKVETDDIRKTLEQLKEKNKYKTYIQNHSGYTWSQIAAVTEAAHLLSPGTHTIMVDGLSYTITNEKY